MKEYFIVYPKAMLNWGDSLVTASYKMELEKQLHKLSFGTYNETEGDYRFVGARFELGPLKVTAELEKAPTVPMKGYFDV